MVVSMTTADKQEELLLQQQQQQQTQLQGVRGEGCSKTDWHCRLDGGCGDSDERNNGVW